MAKNVGKKRIHILENRAYTGIIYALAKEPLNLTELQRELQSEDIEIMPSGNMIEVWESLPNIHKKIAVLIKEKYVIIERTESRSKFYAVNWSKIIEEFLVFANQYNFNHDIEALPNNTNKFEKKDLEIMENNPFLISVLKSCFDTLPKYDVPALDVYVPTLKEIFELIISNGILIKSIYKYEDIVSPESISSQIAEFYEDFQLYARKLADADKYQLTTQLETAGSLGIAIAAGQKAKFEDKFLQNLAKKYQ